MVEFLDSLTNVKVHFLPPNCTSVIQPLDQGIIHAFKNIYRKLIVKFMLLCAEEEREYTPIKTKQAIEYIIYNRGVEKKRKSFLLVITPWLHLPTPSIGVFLKFCGFDTWRYATGFNIKDKII